MSVRYYEPDIFAKKDHCLVVYRRVALEAYILEIGVKLRITAFHGGTPFEKNVPQLRWTRQGGHTRIATCSGRSQLACFAVLFRDCPQLVRKISAFYSHRNSGRSRYPVTTVFFRKNGS